MGNILKPAFVPKKKDFFMWSELICTPLKEDREITADGETQNTAFPVTATPIMGAISP